MSATRAAVHRSKTILCCATAVISFFSVDGARAADLTWNGTNADWTIGANWTPVGPPGVGDVAIINAGNAQLNVNATLLGLRLNGGAISGAGFLTFTGASLWNAGTHSGTGTTQFDNTLTIAGIGGKVLAGGRTLNLNGATNWSGNTGNNNIITLAGASVLNNAGVFTDANAFNSSITVGGGGGTFNNAGTFHKQSNTTTAVDVLFNNTGTLNVSAGTFLPGVGGTSSGLFNIASGAKLEFRNGNHTLNNVTTSGLGTLQISTENVGADAFVTINGGTHTSALLLSGSTLAGTDQTFQGIASWTGGTITGAASTTFANTLTISGANIKVISGGRTVNAGNTTWSGNTAANNTIALSNTSAFRNTGSFTDANTFNSSISGGTFNNAGTFNKQSNTTTLLATVFNSSDQVNVNAGTLLLAGGGTNSGVFNIAAGAKLEYRNGNHTLNNVTTSGLGTLQISTDNVGADARVTLNGGTHTTAVLFSGSVLTGTDQVFQGLVTWTGGTMTGAASTTFNNAVTTISGANAKGITSGRVLNLTGTTNWAGNTANNNNNIFFSNGGTLNNNGTFNDANAFDSFVEHSVGGPHNFNNVGVYNKQSNTITTMDIGIAFNNTGVTNINAGILRPAGGTSTGIFNIAAGAVLDFKNGNSTLNNVTTSGAGTLLISTDNVGADALVTINGGTHTTAVTLSGSTLTGTDHTFQGRASWTGGAIFGVGSTTFSNDVEITGALTKVVAAGRVVNLNATTNWNGNTAANNNAIQFSSAAIINNNGTFNDDNAFASFIEHSIAGGTFNNTGTYNKRANTVTTVDLGLLYTNSGTVNIDAGAMRFFGGVQGPTGTVRVASGATLQQDAASVIGRLITAGTVALSNRSATIHIDYDNANFGVGNAFNAHANVTGTGQILAAGVPALTQAITGTGLPTGSSVSGGNTAAPTLTIGNVHVGNNIVGYQIANNNVGGPALRGALQTTVGGANISDARLSGNGVTAANFGPIAAGASQQRNVTFNAATAGALAPLVSQVVRIANNFDNVAEQNLNIVLGAGAAAFNFATATVTPNPVTVANQHVGDGAVVALTVGNSAAPGSFSEALDAAFGATSGAVLTNSGTVNLLAAGASDGSSLTVGVDSASAGAKSGSVAINFNSNGAGSSSLGITALASKVVDVTGNVYRLAAANTLAPINFGSVHVGDAVQQALLITNTALNDGFSESLNATFGTVSDARITTGGSVNLLGAQQSDNSLLVGLNTAAAGVVNGNVQVKFTSDGAGTSGLGTTALADQNVAVSGDIQTMATVFRLAAASPITPNPVNFGNVRVDTIASQALTLTNTAANDGFSERLDAVFAGTTGAALATGAVNLLAAQASDATNLQVGVNTSVAGHRVGTATIALTSNGTGTSELGNTTLAAQTVSVSADVYRLANPQLNATDITLVARVGDAAPSRSISITNASPDAFTERLNVIVGPTPQRFSTNGAAMGIAAGATSTAISALLDTSAAGSFTGNVVLDFVSSGAGTTGASDKSVGSRSVGLIGRVYAPAIAQVQATDIDFGIVHRGDTVATRNVAVTNASSPVTPSDELRGSLGGANNPFSATGTLVGVAAQTTDSTSFKVGLNTATAGVFDDSAAASFTSHNAELADVTLPGVSIGLHAVINNFAEGTLRKTLGDGAFSANGNVYTLDFGRVAHRASGLSALLGIFNTAFGPADLLDGAFDLDGSSGSAFSFSNFVPFSDIAAGSGRGGFAISFGGSLTGLFENRIALHRSGHNASGYVGDLGDATLLLRGEVFDASTNVPEPSTLLTVLGGVAALLLARRRQRNVVKVRRAAPA